MFGKPFRIKSNSSIKGSDRKKIRAQIAKFYPDLGEDVIKTMIPNKEEMTIMKIYTHSGKNVLVYCLEKTPVFFDVDDIIYPTVYILWKYPDMLPMFTTWPQVFTKITAGADLMLPGVIVKGEVIPANLGDLKKGQPCGVKLLGNKSPVAIGKTAMSSGDMYEAAMRGKGVIVIHSFQDHLWACGEKGNLPMIEDIEMIDYMTHRGSGANNIIEEDGEDGACETPGSEAVQSPDQTGSSGSLEKSIAELQLEQKKSTDDNMESEGAVGVSPVHKQTYEENIELDDSISRQDKMDNLLYQCFLHALKTNVKSKSDLPVLTSKFFKSHMQVCCPPGENLDVKKSTYKKLSKFLGEMAKRGFIKVKELSKGCESIIDVDKNHVELRAYKPPKEIESKKTEAPAETEEVSTGPVQIVDMFMVSAATMPFFKQAGFSKGKALIIPDVRQTLKDYVQANELQSAQYPGCATLDPILSDLVLGKGEYLEHMRLDSLISRTCNKMNPAYQITLPGQRPVIRKGMPAPVVINVAKRGGNKKVTLVNNLETYGVEPHSFAHDVQIGMACSTSVSEMPGQNKGMEVTVQGNQINFISDLLSNKYGVNKKYMQGLEKAPKLGRKK